MGILFVPYPARGHVAPMLAVAAELARRDARVRMVVTERFAAAVRESGVEPLVLGSRHEPRVPAGWSAAEIGQRLRSRRGRRALGPLTVALCRDEPARLVVADPHVRWARTLPLPDGAARAWLWTTAARSAPGRIPVLVNGLPELQAAGRRDARIRFVGPLVGGLPSTEPKLDLPRHGRILVVAPGTVFTPAAADLRQVAEAFRGSDWTVVLATGHLPPGSLGPLPPNVLARRWIPQFDVLRRADVFLTHGGMNSVLEAVFRGVPMLVRPRITEQRRTAARLAALGIGRLLRGPDLRHQVESLAGNTAVLARLHGLRDRVLAEPAAERAATELFRLAYADAKC